MGRKAVAISIVSLLFAMSFSYLPNTASATAYEPLGSTAAYSLVSGGTLVLGATTSYTGVAPVKGACSSVSCDATMVANFATANLNLITNVDTATAAVQAVSAARTLLIGLTKTHTIDATAGISELGPGVYETTSNAALGVTTSFTLNGGGDYDSVFVFRTTAAINFTASIEILFTNGAQPSNIYWVSGTAITSGASSKIPGNLIAVSAITTGESSIVRGSVLGIGAVTLGASSSIVHNAVIPQPLPGAPTSLVATAGNAQAALTWIAPASNGGKPITDYLVEYSANGGTYTTFADGTSATTSTTVTGLTNATSYTFRVSATTSAGTGAASETATAIPSAGLGAPIFLVATAGNAQVVLTWSPPSSSGGTAIAGYTVSSLPTMTAPASCVDTLNLSCTFIGLTNGTQYTFTVAARNGTVVGPASATASATPKTVPNAPTGLAATTASGRVTLTWIAPTINGGSAITGYTVTSSPLVTAPAGCTSTSALSCSFTGLTNATPYTFTVVAINAIGSSTASSPISATPAPTAEEIEAARLAAIAAENARIAAATAESARLAEIARSAAVAAENARIEAATAEIARLAALARAAAIEAARLAAIEAERLRVIEVARLAELERIANCNSTISNIQYSAAAPGSAFGHLSWTHTGSGVFQYFGDSFLYPAFMQYGIYTADWKGYLINLVPGVRYQVSVNYLSDCGQISGVSMSIMNEKEVALTVPVPTPTPTPAPSLVIQIPIPSVTKPPAPIELVQTVKTNAPAPVVTVQGIAFKTVTIKAINQSTVHVILHNLIPGQKVSITLKEVKP